MTAKQQSIFDLPSATDAPPEAAVRHTETRDAADNTISPPQPQTVTPPLSTRDLASFDALAGYVAGW